MSSSDVLQNRSDWPSRSREFQRHDGEVTVLRMLYGPIKVEVKNLCGVSTSIKTSRPPTLWDSLTFGGSDGTHISLCSREGSRGPVLSKPLPHLPARERIERPRVPSCYCTRLIEGLPLAREHRLRANIKAASRCKFSRDSHVLQRPGCFMVKGTSKAFRRLCVERARDARKWLIPHDVLPDLLSWTWLPATWFQF